MVFSNGDDSKQGHLHAGVEQAAGTDDEQAKRGEANGVEGTAVAIKDAADEVERDHPERALHGCGEAGEEGVGEGREQGEECCRDAGQTESAGEPEDASGDDGEVKA